MMIATISSRCSLTAHQRAEWPSPGGRMTIFMAVALFIIVDIIVLLLLLLLIIIIIILINSPSRNSRSAP